jgi:YidC/Oxa1 family membrane protein insertase
MAIVLAMIILFTWQILFPVEQPNYEQENRQETSIDEITISESNNVIPEAVVTCDSEKIIIDNERLEGSIDLCGAQINEIFLKKFNTSADIDSDYVQLFKKDSYWVESGWLAPRGANF